MTTTDIEAQDPDSADYERGYERGIVTFIDILGFKSLLATRSPEQIKEILGKLRHFTKGFANEEAPPTRSDEMRLYSQAFSESVSDAVVRVRTVDTQIQDGGFGHELIDLMHAQVECVNAGILIRGGMTIGPVHVAMGGQEPIFGSAMVRAYEIEENEAVYPRIMIDEKLINAYQMDISLWIDGGFDPDYAQMVENFIGVGDDGSFYLDYLKGAGPGEFDDGVLGQFSFLGRHKEIIEEKLDGSTGSIRRKLVWLANYHNRSVASIRDEYDMDDPDSAFAAAIGVPPRELFDSLLIPHGGANFAAGIAAPQT